MPCKRMSFWWLLLACSQRALADCCLPFCREFWKACFWGCLHRTGLDALALWLGVIRLLSEFSCRSNTAGARSDTKASPAFRVLQRALLSRFSQELHRREVCKRELCCTLHALSSSPFGLNLPSTTSEAFPASRAQAEGCSIVEAEDYSQASTQFSGRALHTSDRWVVPARFRHRTRRGLATPHCAFSQLLLC